MQRMVREIGREYAKTRGLDIAPKLPRVDVPSVAPIVPEVKPKTPGISLPTATEGLPGSARGINIEALRGELKKYHQKHKQRKKALLNG